MANVSINITTPQLFQSYPVSRSLGEATSLVSQGISALLIASMPRSNLIAMPGGPSISLNAVGILGTSQQGFLSAAGIQSNPSQYGSNEVQLSQPGVYNNGVAAALQASNMAAAGASASSILAACTSPLAALRYAQDTLTSANKSSSTAKLAQGNQMYTPYAMDLYNLAPKFKFLFVCEFVFDPNYIDIGDGGTRQNQFATVISTFERPKVKFEYEDQVNYYNFRTRVVKKTTHEPLQIKFLDDQKNLSMAFIYNYLLSLSPITNVSPNSSAFYEDNGMNFNDPLYSGSVNAMMSKAPILTINVYHIYNYGSNMNVYHFTNPKLLSINMDELSMDDSNSSSIVTEFSYDALSVDMAQSMNAASSEVLSTLSNLGMYSLNPWQPGIPNPAPPTNLNNDDMIQVTPVTRIAQNVNSGVSSVTNTGQNSVVSATNSITNNNFFSSANTTDITSSLSNDPLDQTNIA